MIAEQIVIEHPCLFGGVHTNRELQDDRLRRAIDFAQGIALMLTLIVEVLYGQTPFSQNTHGILQEILWHHQGLQFV